MMKPNQRTKWASLLILASLIMGAVGLFVAPVFAQEPDPYQNMCFMVADNENVGTGEDLLSVVDYVSGLETPVGYTGTFDIESIAFQDSTGILFGANGNRLGTFNLSTGVFTALGSPFGTAGGDLGEIALVDVDGLAFDPTNGELFGTHRRGALGELDLLFKINPVTGAHIPGAFPGGDDYVAVEHPTSTLTDVDALAIDVVGGQMYAVANNGGIGDRLVNVDKVTGEIIDLGPLGINDMEGLTFDPTGQMMGTTGKDYPLTNDALYRIDKVTGVANPTPVAQMSVGTDYEAVDCLTNWAPPPPTPTPTEPTAIELLYFKANRVAAGQIRLSWATASEINTYGFNLYRAASPNISGASKIHFETARGGSGQMVYSFTDQAVPGGGRWYYWLEEVENGGRSTLSAPVMASADGMIYLPVIVRR